MAPSSRPSRSTVAALVAIGVLVLVLAWTAHAIVAHDRLQNCLDSGRRTCMSLPGEDGR